MYIFTSLISDTFIYSPPLSKNSPPSISTSTVVDSLTFVRASIVSCWETTSLASNKDKFIVYLLGFTQFGHTNWYPWKKFQEVFEHLGYECRWVEKEDIKQHPGKRRVFISWYDPDTIELINDGIYQDGDIILNKLVCFGKYDSGIEWGTTPEERD